MSKASKYTPTTNFNDQQASAGAVQGVSMDVEYGAIKNALNDNADKLDQIRRSDSTAGNPRLNNGVVWPETLAPATINLLTLATNTAYSIKGEWNQEAEYAVNDVVSVAYVIPGYGSLLSVTMEDELGSVIAAFQQPVDISAGGLSAEEFEDANGKTVSYTTGSSPDGDGTAIFLCLEAHTSSTDFDTDFAAGYWFQIGGSRATSTPGAESAQAAAEAAQAAAETAQGLAEDAQVGAEAAEENAEIAQAAAEAAAASVDLPVLVADRMLVANSTPEWELQSFDETLETLGGGTFGINMFKATTSSAGTALLNLGTAASVNTGTDSGDVPTVADLGEGAFRNGASQATAEAGTDNTDFMTALRVTQAIAALGGEKRTLISEESFSGGYSAAWTGLDPNGRYELEVAFYRSAYTNTGHVGIQLYNDSGAAWIVSGYTGRGHEPVSPSTLVSDVFMVINGDRVWNANHPLLVNAVINLENRPVMLGSLAGTSMNIAAGRYNVAGTYTGIRVGFFNALNWATPNLAVYGVARLHQLED